MRLCLAVALGVLGSMACATASTVDRYYDKSGNASGGSFQYLNNGADFVIQSRIEDGMRQAESVCGERRVVIREEHGSTRSGGSIKHRDGNTVTTTPLHYNYQTVYYDCAD